MPHEGWTHFYVDDLVILTTEAVPEGTATGVIVSIGEDSLKRPLYAVLLDEPAFGIYHARNEELKLREGYEQPKEKQ